MDLIQTQNHISFTLREVFALTFYHGAGFWFFTWAFPFPELYTSCPHNSDGNTVLFPPTNIITERPSAAYIITNVSRLKTFPRLWTFHAWITSERFSSALIEDDNSHDPEILHNVIKLRLLYSQFDWGLWSINDGLRLTISQTPDLFCGLGWNTLD